MKKAIYLIFLFLTISNFVLSCEQEKSDKGMNNKSRINDNVGGQGNIEKNPQVIFDDYFTSINCKRNYKSEQGKRGPALKVSKLFSKLEKNPQLTCFLKNNLLVATYNYESFIRSICAQHSEKKNECREVAENYLYCLKPKYSETPFFQISVVYGYETLVERTERIFVDGQTGELIDELVQEIDSESCKGPFYDKDGNIIKEQ